MNKWANLQYLLPHEHLRQLITMPLENFAKEHPEETKLSSGIQLQIWVFTKTVLGPNNTLEDKLSCVTLAASQKEMVSKVMIYMCNKNPLDENGEIKNVEHTDVGIRIDLPFFFAFDRIPINKYGLYHIRFCIPEEETRLSENESKPLLRGYFGITKRGYMTRFWEHFDKAKNNTGYLFHSVWHSLLKEKIQMYPAVQITGTANSLKEIYQLEENLVGELTLTPMGLNAIPGGMAGIKMMHELRLLNSTKVGIEERDEALIALQQRTHAHGSPCAHYRRGHMRKLDSEKLTFVKPCWVNLKTSENVLEAA